MKGLILDKIKKHGQPYLDEPVYATPKPVGAAVVAALGMTPPGPVLVAYDRVQLKWVKPA